MGEEATPAVEVAVEAAPSVEAGAETKNDLKT
jgi:hypothetical protein